MAAATTPAISILMPWGKYMGNIGAALRTCHLMGARLVTRPVSRTAMRKAAYTSLGVGELVSTDAWMDEFAGHLFVMEPLHIWVERGLEGEAVPAFDVRARGGDAFLFGHEKTGVDFGALDGTTYTPVFIPQVEDASLNVASTVAIVLSSIETRRRIEERERDAGATCTQ